MKFFRFVSMGIAKSKCIGAHERKRQTFTVLDVANDAACSTDVRSTLVWYSYNLQVMEELRLLQDAESSPASTLERTPSGNVNKTALELEIQTDKRLEIEALVSPDEHRNYFTSFSPWKYKISFPLATEKRDLAPSVEEAEHHSRVVNLEIALPSRNVFIPTLVLTSDTSVLNVMKLVFATQPETAHACELSSQFGRMLAYDFIRDDFPSLNSETIKRVPVWLMIHHLCWVFRFNIVDGIPFVELNVADIAAGVNTRFQRLNTWLERSRSMTADEMMAEFSRLIKLAFKVRTVSKLVFVFTSVERLVRRDTNLLLHLLTEFSASCPRGPIVICAGDFLGDTEESLRKQFLCVSNSTEACSERIVDTVTFQRRHSSRRKSIA